MSNLQETLDFLSQPFQPGSLEEAVFEVATKLGDAYLACEATRPSISDLFPKESKSEERLCQEVQR